MVDAQKLYQRRQEATAYQPEQSYEPPIFGVSGFSQNDPLRPKQTSKIREELRLWNEQYGQNDLSEILEIKNDVDQPGAVNTFTRLGGAEDIRDTEEMEEHDRDEMTNLLQSRIEDLENLDPEHRFLRKGDLAELEFTKSEKDSTLGIFIRRIGEQNAQCQFFTVTGKWLHIPERQVQFSLPGYTSSDLVDKLIPYLPSRELTDEELDQMQFQDLSVPREFAAPIVLQLLQFQRESERIYRQHASRLDAAHDLLSHPTDLKFGSLEQVTRKLLSKPTEEAVLPTELFAVRKVLAHAGFAFGSDRRSHRMTGFLQIRSKEQVEMVARVRQYMREWQDGIAKASTSDDPTAEPAFTQNAKHIVRFLEKARRFIDRSRIDRDATLLGNVGPSKIRRAITRDQDSTTFKYHEPWSSPDRDIIKFMEGWSCSNMYLGLPRLESLPPLLLQATGKYKNAVYNQGTGFMFLQEIGVMLPYENRTRFDQHLLLPSSQHSRPLETLMSKISTMNETHGFQDSMAHLRHDWGDLPVFCVDQAGAHEIDDGISIESAGDGEHWVHMHIANPTAFFDHTSPLAKMARHMTETIYMPERAFVMLPRWASQEHFSLGKDRPCLTFSAKFNASGEFVENKVVPGIIRNVINIEPSEIDQVLNSKVEARQSRTLTVGGQPPLVRHRGLTKSHELSSAQRKMIATLAKLAHLRQATRLAAGGYLLDPTKPDVTVWNHYKRAGLGWDHPSRTVSRTVEGDPIIQFNTTELVSSPGALDNPSKIMVQEMMLLACEVAARWCHDRNIPIVYRGSIPRPGDLTAEEFSERVLKPAMEKNNGIPPLHLAFEFLRHQGATRLTTEPLKHTVLGLSHYAKVTSPLRRYGDMIVHWQIEAALRAEAEGKKLNSESDTSDTVPFSEGILKQMMVGLQPRELLIRRTMNYALGSWICQLMFRAFHYGECELPSTMTAVLMNPPPAARQTQIPVYVKEFNIQGSMFNPEEHGFGPAQNGDQWEVAIYKVDVYYRRIQLLPLRLISRWED
ncbi:hypothetical protein MBLNU457_3068t1 [Dothideomycetes sp. NU457]